MIKPCHTFCFSSLQCLQLLPVEGFVLYPTGRNIHPHKLDVLYVKQKVSTTVAGVEFSISRPFFFFSGKNKRKWIGGVK